jgi:hypothetical protein
MRFQTYEGTGVDDLSSFDFTSVGPNGAVKKRIIISPTGKETLFYLSLVDIGEDGEPIDDSSVTNNGDRDKILATVVKAVRLYTELYPHRWVYLSGSTLARTRLYRMIITIHLEELSEIFDIYGVFEDGQPESFRLNTSYEGFLVGKK